MAMPSSSTIAGISIHGQYRVATENTLFAMPETAIGLFPDVGSMFWMPRLLSKPIANYLALTGQRIRACELCHFGMATHYILSKDLPDLEKALIEATSSLRIPETSAVASGKEIIADILQLFQRPVETKEESILMKHQFEIERAFGADTVEDILENLKEGDGDFEQATLATLQKMSPTSLKVTFEGLRRGAQCKTIADDLKMEYRMAKACIVTAKSDFYEGVRAVLVDKDHSPKWNPPTLEEVSERRVAAFFASVEDELDIPEQLACRL